MSRHHRGPGQQTMSFNMWQKRMKNRHVNTNIVSTTAMTKCTHHHHADSHIPTRQGNNHYSIYIIYDEVPQRATLNCIRLTRKVRVCVSDLLRNSSPTELAKQDVRLTAKAGQKHSTHL